MTSAESLATILSRTRQSLLDLSLRNRLINTPRGSARSTRLDIVDELSDEIFRLLVVEDSSLTFLPSGSAKPVAEESRSAIADELLSQPDDVPSAPSAAQQRDKQLQTSLSSTKLQERLLGLYYDARTFEEEQGVSVLYLALGFLEWYEKDIPDKSRFAPLILVPVDLARTSASSRFRLKSREGDLETNLSLQAKLKADCDVGLPELNVTDGWTPSNYFAQVESAIAVHGGWKVHGNEMALWFFSFAKYLMYRDLDPDNWPDQAPLQDNPTLRQLLVDGFAVSPPICDDMELIDPIMPPGQLLHITDADSSQAIVIEEVRRGRNLVVQGPPGTGKSQTITNMIAAAVHGGKKVLFIAEKMAALDVVKRRLDRLGLGSVCLELHSHKSNKKATLEELNRTLELKRPRVESRAEIIEELTEVRDRLNRHVAVMNSAIQPSDVTPFQIIGQLVECHSDGIATIPFQLCDPSAWTRAEFERRCRQLAELEAIVIELGSVASHPWRGVRRAQLLMPSEQPRLLERLRVVADRLQQFRNDVLAFAREFQIPVPERPSLKSLQDIIGLARHGLDRPPLDCAAMADPIWEIHPCKIQRLVEQGQLLEDARNKLAGVITEGALTTDLSATRHALISHGRCWCWFVYPDYWQAQSTLRSLVRDAVPSRLDQQLELIETIMIAQSALREIRAHAASVGQKAFGSFWNADTTDFTALQAIVDWEQRGREARFAHPFRKAITATGADLARMEKEVETLQEKWSSISTEWQAICQTLEFDVRAAFDIIDEQMIPLADLLSRLAEWQQQSESLSKWISYQQRRAVIESDRAGGTSVSTGTTEKLLSDSKAKSSGAAFGSLVEELERGSIGGTEIVARFRQAYYEALFARVLQTIPELARFHGASHEQLVRRFQELDLERMKVARSEVAENHFKSLPRESSLGEMAIVRGEIAKKRMHRPIRQLLSDAGHAIQSIKPVFMMSPISVAQFLEPGGLEFDLLIMDEASQVTPEDALGAIARAKQIVVVGDSRQLPPSRFFNKLLEDDESAESGELIETSHLDSVLGLCVARGLPQRMLRWHYRSRHHSLIAVSNHEFYDNKLCVIPSPSSVSDGVGLQFRHLPDGRFDRGGSATNSREAELIADAAIDHARRRPTKSLGVTAFSMAQRDAIRRALESRLRKNPELDEFFSPARYESFFVKNLENIQGDERDFIFISVGYGPDESGNVTMNFGPLGVDGGERRLNVLISRAKESCVVFSSITADQIDTNRARSRGAAALKSFLKFAQTGQLEADSSAKGSCASKFEQQVASAIEQSGLAIESRVGTDGVAIDVAIVDPESESRYLLGIDCDGENYGSSRWARDRDRLRETVLTDRGWHLHRVWSCDWFHRPNEELNKILSHVERVRSTPAQSEANSSLSTELAEESVPPILREESTDIPSTPAIEVPQYVEADFPVPIETPIVEIETGMLSEIVKQIVTIEGPVHRQEAARRILSLWQQQRSGPAMTRKIDAAIDRALHADAFAQDSNQFLAITDDHPVAVRSRHHVKSPGLRKPEFIPPAEIHAAIKQLVTAHVGITRDELCSAVTRLLGLKIVTPKLRTLIELKRDEAIERGELTERETKLYLVKTE